MDFIGKNAVISEGVRKKRDAFRQKLERMSDDELMDFVPDVYQKNIYQIDYQKLKAAGIRLISFDIDDTIKDSVVNKMNANIPGLEVTMPDKAKKLFQELKDMGFTVTLLSNAQKKLAKAACKDLGADGYIARAEKPHTESFEKILDRYGFGRMQMAHVGNNIRQDVAGGNKAAITTCLVRRAGVILTGKKQILKAFGVRSKSHLVKKELERRGLWRQHHKYDKGDQYYQLREIPAYIYLAGVRCIQYQSGRGDML